MCVKECNAFDVPVDTKNPVVAKLIVQVAGQNFQNFLQGKQNPEWVSVPTSLITEAIGEIIRIENEAVEDDAASI